MLQKELEGTGKRGGLKVSVREACGPLRAAGMQLRACHPAGATLPCMGSPWHLPAHPLLRPFVQHSSIHVAEGAQLPYASDTAAHPLLQSFELPKAIHIESECFTVDNELMTPTFELRRTQLLRKYEAQVGAGRLGRGWAAAVHLHRLVAPCVAWPSS